MGAAAGAGGIGFDMFMSSSFYLDRKEICAITYFILAVAITLEVFAAKIKRKLKTAISDQVLSCLVFYICFTC